MKATTGERIASALILAAVFGMGSTAGIAGTMPQDSPATDHPVRFRVDGGSCSYRSIRTHLRLLQWRRGNFTRRGNVR